LERRGHVPDIDFLPNIAAASKAFPAYLVARSITMDPVSALGIAASVVQFLQFGSSLVSKIRQIYSQGALSDHVECESATRRLVDLTKQITNDLTDLGSLGALSLDSQALQKICEKCVELSNELLSRLADLHGNETHKARKWKSFRHALKTVCSKEKIDDIAGRLKGYSVELHLHLIMAIKYVCFRRCTIGVWFANSTDN
jgi:hypothetical protein